MDRGRFIAQRDLERLKDRVTLLLLLLMGREHPVIGDKR